MPRWLPTSWGPYGSAGQAGGATDTPNSDCGNLILWAASNAWQLLTAVYDSTNTLQSGTIQWPDGSAGTYTRTLKNASFNTVDAYILTHTDTGSSVQQEPITRDAWGMPIVVPPLTCTGYVGTTPDYDALYYSVCFENLTEMRAATITAQMVMLKQDANGNSGLFCLNGSDVSADDGVNTVIDAASTHFTRVSPV